MSTDDAPLDYTLTDYVVADAVGAIQHHGRIPMFMIASQPLQDGQVSVLGTGTAATSYILDGVVTARPANTAVLDGMKISNVPNPSTVTIDGGEPATVTDGEVDLEFTQPGTYSIQVSSWPMLDATFTVTQS